MIKVLPKGEVGEIGREVIHIMIELGTEGEVSEVDG